MNCWCCCWCCSYCRYCCCYSCCCYYWCCWSDRPIFKVWLKSGPEQLRYWWHWVCGGGGGGWSTVIFVSNPTFKLSYGWVGVVTISKCDGPPSSYIRINSAPKVLEYEIWKSNKIWNKCCCQVNIILFPWLFNCAELFMFWTVNIQIFIIQFRNIVKLQSKS